MSVRRARGALLCDGRRQLRNLSAAAFRTSGREAYDSLRGPFKLEGKPLLVDEKVPLDTPITGNQRVKVLPATESAWLVAYLPRGLVTADEAWKCLERLRQRGGLAAERFTP